MMLICYFLAVLLVLPTALLIGCAAVEASLMKNNPQMSWLLPAGAMLASAMLRQSLDGSSGLDALLWSIPAFCGRYAVQGTAAGAAIGAVMRWFSAPKELNPA